MLLSITIKKTGRTYSCDTDKLPDASKEYLFENGYSQRMRDVHADIQRKDFDTVEAWQTAVNAATDHAHNQIMTGEFRVKAPVDPVLVEVRKMGITLAEWEAVKATIDKARAKAKAA